MSDKEQLFVYEDEYTGKKYLFDGTKLVELPDNIYDNDDNKPPYHIETEDDDESEFDDNSDETNNSSSNQTSNVEDTEEDDDFEDSSNNDSLDDNELSDNESEENEDDSSSSSSSSNSDNNKQENSTNDNNNSSDNYNDSDESQDTQTSDSTQSNNNDSESNETTEESEEDSEEYDDSDESEDDYDSDEYESEDDYDESEEDEYNSNENDSDVDDDFNSSEKPNFDDIDWDNIDWNELKDVVDEILDQIENLSEEQQQKFYDELKKHLDEVDENVLEKEQEERQKQIEQEIGEYNPEDDDSEARIKEIANDLQNDSVYKDLMDETDRHVYQDRTKRNNAKKKAEQEANKYNASKGVQDFVLDLNRLIKREVKKLNSTSWGKINKKMDGTGVMKPGKTKKKNPDIPRLFVYFDQSGSWGPSDIEIGIKAIETLNTYVKKNQLIIELYYFANNVYDNSSDARHEGGTGAGKKLIEHIKANKPDNVCVMTDDDFDWYIGGRSESDISQAPTTIVPGGVFLMFRNGEVSKGLVDKLRGRKLTKIYAF